MGKDLELRKLSIIEYLAETDDEALIQQIEHLLKPKIDFWDDLTSNQQSSLLQGLAQLERGERRSLNSFLSHYHQKRAK